MCRQHLSVCGPRADVDNPVFCKDGVRQGQYEQPCSLQGEEWGQDFELSKSVLQCVCVYMGIDIITGKCGSHVAVDRYG